MGRKRSGNYWAVEFAGEQVRLCHFRLRGKQVAVHHCETRPVAEFDFGRFRQENPANGSSDAEILCAVPRSEVFLKPFTVPRSEETDFRQMTALKLEQSVGELDPARTLWGYFTGGTPDGKKRIRVLAAAVPRAFIEELLSRHFTNSERPTIVECAALAAVRAHLAFQPQTVHCELVVDCASDGFSFFVLRESEIESVHFVPSDRPLETVVAEIRRLILLHGGKRESAPIESATCLGGQAAEQLVAALQTTMDIPVVSRLGRTPSWVENAENLPADWDREWHRVAGLMALARTGIQAAINFLAAEAPERRALSVMSLFEQLRSPILVMTLVALLGATFLGHRALSKRRVAKMTEIVQKGRQISADLQRHEQALAILKRYSGERFSLTNLLVEIAQIAPTGITLDTLTLNADNSLALTGRCQSYGEVQTFATKLNQSQLFTKAEVPSRRRERDGVTFKMTFSLTPKAKKVVK